MTTKLIKLLFLSILLGAIGWEIYVMVSPAVSHRRAPEEHLVANPPESHSEEFPR